MSITVAPDALGFMLSSSVRYCLGRLSYAPSQCRDLVRGHAGQVPHNFRRAMVRDIDEWIAGRTLYTDRAGRLAPAEDGEWALLADWLAANFQDCADERQRRRPRFAAEPA